MKSPGTKDTYKGGRALGLERWEAREEPRWCGQRSGSKAFVNHSWGMNFSLGLQSQQKVLHR